jgi:hypothetical protein
MSVSEDGFRGMSASVAIVAGVNLEFKIHTVFEKGPASDRRNITQQDCVIL